MNIEIEKIDANRVGIYSYYKDKKIGLSFDYSSKEEFYTRFGEACAAILRRIDIIECKEDNASL